MSLDNKIRDIFHSLLKDGKLLFIVLATLLATFPIITFYTLNHCLEKSLFVAIPFAFAWVVFAWAITDRSVLRRFKTYAFIFIVLFFERIYWDVFNYLYPSNSIDSLSELVNTQETAYYIFILAEFIAMLAVFLTIWHLAKPKEFKSRNSKSISLVVFSAFLMTFPLWTFRFLSSVYGEDFSSFFIENIGWHNFLFQGIPIAFSLLVFAMVITNIKKAIKNMLYVLIFVFTFFNYLPFYKDSIPDGVFFVIVGFCYFIVFLSFVLLSKSKYIEN